MVQSWQLQDAKNKLSKVIDDALEVGPQLITRRSSEAVIVLAYSEYKRIIAPKEKLSDFFQNSPLVDIDLELSRDKNESRGEFEL